MFDRIVNLFKRKKEKASSGQELEGQRFNDGVMLIRQDNLSKEINIIATNSNALKLLGYKNEELVGQDLRRFLTDEEVSDVNDFTDFEDGEKDFAEVLSKVRYFKMLGKDLEYVPLRLRVVRSISQQNAPCFQMIFNDNALQQSLDQGRAEMLGKMDESKILDEATGLRSFESVVKDVEILSFYADRRESGSVMASFELLEAAENPDLNVIRSCLAAAIEICKRDEDISARIADNCFLFILVETPMENCSIPIQRVQSKFIELAGEKEIEQIPLLKVRHVQIIADVGAEEQISTVLA